MVNVHVSLGLERLNNRAKRVTYDSEWKIREAKTVWWWNLRSSERMDELGKAIIGNSGCEKPWNKLKKKKR